MKKSHSKWKYVLKRELVLPLIILCFTQNLTYSQRWEQRILKGTGRLLSCLSLSKAFFALRKQALMLGVGGACSATTWGRALVELAALCD